jgi:hypothetical protein
MLTFLSSTDLTQIPYLQNLSGCRNRLLLFLTKKSRLAKRTSELNRTLFVILKEKTASQYKWNAQSSELIQMVFGNQSRG